MTRDAHDVWARYRAYLRAPPEIVMEWADSGTGARGWLVINSFRGDAAGGGTRMRIGLGREEVVYLAKTMELKFVFAGPPIGGAKAGIDFDPRDERKPDVLGRWFTTVAPYLRERYGTGGDLNVDERRDVIPHCRALGLGHPQEGIVRGHLRRCGADLDRTVDNLSRGIGARLEPEVAVAGTPLIVADVAAGFGLAFAIERLSELHGRDLSRARVMLEGFGKVGASCAIRLARAGARVVTITEAEKTLIVPGGLGRDELEDLVGRSAGGLLPEDARCVRGIERERAWDQKADIFVTAAISESIDQPKLARLRESGVSVIACGANHPFREKTLGATELQRSADERFSIIADVVGGAGAACAYSYLMGAGANTESEAVLGSVEKAISDAVDEIVDRSDAARDGLLAATLECALDRARRGVATQRRPYAAERSSVSPEPLE